MVVLLALAVLLLEAAYRTCVRLTLWLGSSQRSACPGEGEGESFSRSAATCGNDACAAAISSIDDSTLTLMKTGFQVMRVLAVVLRERVCSTAEVRRVRIKQ